MKHSTYKLFRNILLMNFLAFGIFSSTSFAQTGVVLANGYVVQVQKVKCGYINGKWLPGSILKTGNFLSLSEKLSSLNKKYKNKKTKPSAKAKLKKQIDSLKKTQKKNSKFCKGIPAPQAIIVNPTQTPMPQITPATPLPGATTVAWNVDAASQQANLGSEYLYFCPANPTDAFRSIYGNDTYTTDSPICVAALHAGLFVRASGGNVKFRIKGNQTFYVGAVRNSVQSNFFGSYPYSYSFIDIGSGAEIVSNSIPEVTWAQTAQPLYTYLEQQFTFYCPSGVGLTRSVWGTGTYTYDSSLCTAAVHAGKISVINGGVITIQIKPGAASYTGSLSNGISSNSYGSWGGSYIFVG